MKAGKMLLAMVLLATVGCVKEKGPAIEKEGKANLRTQGKAAVNPYDQSGAEHNKVLENVWDYIQESADTTEAAKRGFICRYYEEKGVKDASEKMDAIVDRYQRNDLIQVLDQNRFTYRGNYMLRSIFDTVSKMEQESDFGMMYDTLLKLEQQALNEDLPEQEKAGILQVIAITKYSSVFWKERLLDNEVKQEGKGIFQRVLRFISAVQQDTTGALYGMLSGGDLTDVVAEAGYHSSLMGWYINSWL